MSYALFYGIASANSLKSTLNPATDPYEIEQWSNGYKIVVRELECIHICGLIFQTFHVYSFTHCTSPKDPYYSLCFNNRIAFDVNRLVFLSYCVKAIIVIIVVKWFFTFIGFLKFNVLWWALGMFQRIQVNRFIMKIPACEK